MCSMFKWTAHEHGDLWDAATSPAFESFYVTCVYIFLGVKRFYDICVGVFFFFFWLFSLNAREVTLSALV